MSKFASVLVAIIMMFTFSACSGEDTATPTAPVTVTAEATPQDTGEISDTEFADMIRDNTDAFDTSSDANIVGAAKAVCSLWDVGGTFDNVVEAIIDSGVDPEDSGFLSGAGTQTYCPEYADQLP